MTHAFNEFIGTQAGLVLAFSVAAALVVFVGIRLSIYGDALGDRTGLGNGLVGLVFLAGATSLPELVVSLTSVLHATDRSQGADLAIGNMLGSNVFNLLILALMALFFSRKFKPVEMDNPHTDSIAYGLVMLGLFSAAFVMSKVSDWLVPGLGCFWPVTALPVAYLLVLMREHRQVQEGADDHLPAETKLSQRPALRFYGMLLLLSALIIAGGILLSVLGSRMALPPEQGGFNLEAGRIGTVFLAISTSLPELVISFASIRMGFLDMAVGNVLGSNIFNLLIIFVVDVALRKGSLLAHASTRHWTSVVLILILTLLSTVLLKQKTRRGSTSIALGMVMIYIVTFAFLS